MKKPLKSEIANALTTVVAELERGPKNKAKTDKLAQVCAANGIPFNETEVSASDDMEFDEWTDMYKKAYGEEHEPEGVTYLDKVQDNQDELEAEEDGMSGEEIMAQVDQLHNFAEDGKLDKYITVMEHQVEASTGDRAVANQLLVMIARAIRENSPATVSRSLRKLTSMAS